MLPRSVEIVTGDVGDPSSLKAAVQGCNKIIYCATARSTITGDLNRVDYQGVSNLTKAFQDYNHKLAQLRAGKSSKSKLLLAKFKSENSLDEWEVRQGTYFLEVQLTMMEQWMQNLDSPKLEMLGGYVELTKKLSLPLDCTLDRYEGLVLSVGGNGRSYVLILEAGPLTDTTQSKLYFARFTAKVGFCRVRIPFSSFWPVKLDDPPLDPFLVRTLTICFEPRRQCPMEGPAGANHDLQSFKLVLEYIKALPIRLSKFQGPICFVKSDICDLSGSVFMFRIMHECIMRISENAKNRRKKLIFFVICLITFTALVTYPRPCNPFSKIRSFYLRIMLQSTQLCVSVQTGQETDFILVSCTGLGVEPSRREQVLKAKKEEPGGQRAPLFDQGNRISRGISCADVADICVKALHDSTARNKSFDVVCYEYVAEPGKELYELRICQTKQITILTPALFSPREEHMINNVGSMLMPNMTRTGNLSYILYGSEIEEHLHTRLFISRMQQLTCDEPWSKLSLGCFVILLV
ncbi:NADH:ubiquinone oxidoreductase intermediate-associated protein 30 [Dillenia turbinata]|uniref:NADH:ubiquinone oxidoreductase intermediate-associated protein 30 n=1 Tax=Dillenia turbinata TaxID=194707 RepID=A0AAN8UHG1_9MAGN